MGWPILLPSLTSYNGNFPTIDGEAGRKEERKERRKRGRKERREGRKEDCGF